MYLVGQPHPNREAARELVERIVRPGERIVTSAEVLRAILHRYWHLERPDAIQPAVDVRPGLADWVFPIEIEDVQRGHAVLRSHPRLSARGAVHYR